ncbi:MAG: hypothetical protein ACXWP6_20890, partial [Ktedonobacterales bacterium]
EVIIYLFSCSSVVALGKYHRFDHLALAAKHSNSTTQSPAGGHHTLNTKRPEAGDHSLLFGPLYLSYSVNC